MCQCCIDFVAVETDADTLIVSCVLCFSRSEQTITVVGKNSDVFIMLLSHWHDGLADIYIRNKGKLHKSSA